MSVQRWGEKPYHSLDYELKNDLERKYTKFPWTAVLPVPTGTALWAPAAASSAAVPVPGISPLPAVNRLPDRLKME